VSEAKVRPEILFPLFQPITSLAGVGPRLAKLFEQLAGPKVVDLCWHLPSGLIDRRYAPKAAEAEPGRVATIELTVMDHRPGRTSRQPYRVLCSDSSGELELVFFHARPDYLNRLLPIGEQVLVSGRVEIFGGRPQMTHPDHVGRPQDRKELQKVEPVYPLTAGLSLKLVSKAVAASVKLAPELPEWCDPALVGREGWAPWREALEKAHSPQENSDLAPTTPSRRRLAYDELLANQLALVLMRAAMKRKPGRVIRGDGHLRRKVIEALPFSLTSSQLRAVSEIEADMADSGRMLRLLQGDVGSGKTVVALLAMLIAVESGAQAAIMAPTEILARQHYETLKPLAEAAGVEIILLTGRDKSKARGERLAALAEGRAALAVGTHALFQQEVAFKDLAFAVIDEQHRFGVHQRLNLAAKGEQVDVLVMTATPIPRTLMLTAYGDMVSSQLTEKPAGRKPVDTRTLPLERLPDVVEGLKRALDGGARVYWVCPLISESENSDLAAAEERLQHLRKVFGEKVGLVHGRMKGPERDAVMTAFKAGEVTVLVATTVIEVGVDVPEATVMVIEHAERFGLSQLHQLRGRIGRGSEKSSCLLLYQQPLGSVARARLEVMRETEDGFKIAEQDLKLRGAGEVLGTRQSGMPSFRLADIAIHDDLLAMARDDAKLIVERDPDLKGARGKALRTLLYLFERDNAVRYLRSG
jgi:ATP-dependent DNA helicase RecG